MRVAVCGGVGWTDTATLCAELDRLLAVSSGTTEMVVLTGMAPGADELARDWAQRNQVELVAECLDAGEYPTPMHDYNEMLIRCQPDIVLAFKDGFDPTALRRGHEPGTEHLVRLARQAQIKVRVLGARQT